MDRNRGLYHLLKAQIALCHVYIIGDLQDYDIKSSVMQVTRDPEEECFYVQKINLKLTSFHISLLWILDPTFAGKHGFNSYHISVLCDSPSNSVSKCFQLGKHLLPS